MALKRTVGFLLSIHIHNAYSYDIRAIYHRVDTAQIFTGTKENTRKTEKKKKENLSHFNLIINLIVGMQLWKKLLCVFLVAIASGEIIEAAPRKVYAGQISAFGI